MAYHRKLQIGHSIGRVRERERERGGGEREREGERGEGGWRREGGKGEKERRSRRAHMNESEI
jgi:hypothetical protein